MFDLLLSQRDLRKPRVNNVIDMRRVFKTAVQSIVHKVAQTLCYTSRVKHRKTLIIVQY